MAKKKFMVRQGDVLVAAVAKIPAAATEIEKPEGGRSILVHGTATGHSHAVDAKLGVITRIPANGNRFLRVAKGGVDLVHEEHTTINLPAGNYQIIRQREYDDSGEIRFVAD